jgi:hypothetical protein
MAIELTPEDICVYCRSGPVSSSTRNGRSFRREWRLGQKYVGIPLENAESPVWAIVSVATDPDNMRMTGSYQVVAELAEDCSY